VLADRGDVELVGEGKWSGGDAKGRGMRDVATEDGATISNEGRDGNRERRGGDTMLLDKAGVDEGEVSSAVYQGVNLSRPPARGNGDREEVGGSASETNGGGRQDFK
jgi:hypothetical protein